MDRTTLTANLKPLERRRLVRVGTDKEDRRSRVMALTPAGEKLLAFAIPVWERAHGEIDDRVGKPNTDRLRADLRKVSGSRITVSA